MVAWNVFGLGFSAATAMALLGESLGVTNVVHSNDENKSKTRRFRPWRNGRPFVSLSQVLKNVE
jgi:hypothetical protein